MTVLGEPDCFSTILRDLLDVNERICHMDPHDIRQHPIVLLFKVVGLQKRSTTHIHFDKHLRNECTTVLSSTVKDIA